MTRTIYLQGKMGELFGKVWNLNAATVRECMHGIDCQREGKLKQYLLDCTEQGINFTVQRGEEFLDYDNLQMELGKDDLIITPIPAGSGNKLLKVIVGFALLVTGAWIAAGALELGALATATLATAVTLVGSVLLNSGVAEYMAPKSPGDTGDAFLFDGPVNTVKQGVPVPLAYGQILAGGGTISFGFTDTAVNSHRGFTFGSSTGGTTSTGTQSPPNSGVAKIAEASTPSGVSSQVPLNIDMKIDTEYK